MLSKYSLDDKDEGMREPEEMTPAVTSSSSSSTVAAPLTDGCDYPAKTQPPLTTQALEVDRRRDNAASDDHDDHDGSSRKMVCPDDERLGAVGGPEPIVLGEQAACRSVENKSSEVQMALDDLDEWYVHSRKRTAGTRRNLKLLRSRHRTDGDAMAIKKALLVETGAYLENRVGHLEVRAELHFAEKDRKIAYLESIVAVLQKNAEEKDRTIHELKRNQALQEERIKRLERNK